MYLLVFKKYTINAHPLNLVSHCLFYFVCIFTILSSIFGSDSSYTHVYIYIRTHTQGVTNSTKLVLDLSSMYAIMVLY